MGKSGLNCVVWMISSATAVVVLLLLYSVALVLFHTKMICTMFTAVVFAEFDRIRST